MVNCHFYVAFEPYAYLGLFKKIVALKSTSATGQQRMLAPPRHLILPSHMSEVRVALHSIL
jgi:hypothetical protein